MDKFDLEDRLVDFAVLTIKLSKLLPNNYIGNHLGGQLVRSGTSTALNYGEAQSAESRKDFLHKIKIVLKELRETLVCLKIITRSDLMNNNDLVVFGIKESNELISIFVKSTRTVQKNLIKPRD